MVPADALVRVTRKVYRTAKRGSHLLPSKCSWFPREYCTRGSCVIILTDIEGIGVAIAESVIRYFRDQRNIEIIERLRMYGVQMEISSQAQEGASNKLEGKSIVISGVFAKHSRDEYKQMIELHGGKNVGSYLV